MITVKIADLLNSTEVLQKLSKTQLKAKTAWQVSRVLKLAEEEIQTFNDTRMEVLKKYAEKDENGELITDENNNCKIIQSEITKFNNELTELLENEIELNVNKINIEDLNDIDFTPAEINALESFIDFGE